MVVSLIRTTRSATETNPLLPPSSPCTGSCLLCSEPGMVCLFRTTRCNRNLAAHVQGHVCCVLILQVESEGWSSEVSGGALQSLGSSTAGPSALHTLLQVKHCTCTLQSHVLKYTVRLNHIMCTVIQDEDVQIWSVCICTLHMLNHVVMWLALFGFLWLCLCDRCVMWPLM